MNTRKTYSAPTLTEMGSVEDLTQGPWGGRFDSLFGADGGFNPFDPPPGGGGETS